MRPIGGHWPRCRARLASMLELEASMAAVAEAHAHADRALVVARGYEYATAREWAIKIKELAHVFADPYSAADFQHGPVALVEPGVPVIMVVRDGPTARRPDRAARSGCATTSMPT